MGGRPSKTITDSTSSGAISRGEVLRALDEAKQKTHNDRIEFLHTEAMRVVNSVDQCLKNSLEHKTGDGWKTFYTWPWSKTKLCRFIKVFMLDETHTHELTHADVALLKGEVFRVLQNRIPFEDFDLYVNSDSFWFGLNELHHEIHIKIIVY